MKLTGAQVTPEAAVFARGDSGVWVVYRGRIDNLYADFGKSRWAPTTHDLEQVLEEILEGKSLDRKVPRAVGCFIPNLE